jgi:hypothetical protein
MTTGFIKITENIDTGYVTFATVVDADNNNKMEWIYHFDCSLNTCKWNLILESTSDDENDYNVYLK